MVRAEKVQAALRSQHQRGKKRSDLSDSERLELTRTRNREHARSTRYVKLIVNHFFKARVAAGTWKERNRISHQLLAFFVFFATGSARRLATISC
jgi:hypothetical protein